jgi:predicted amidohydrolase
MKKPLHAALVVNSVTAHWSNNLANAVKMIQKAAEKGSNLVLLGEMAVTGMVNNDIPLHDLPYAETITGPITKKFSETASKLKIWLAFGLLEREGTSFYDTALLLSPDGNIALQYRRIHPGWHGAQAPEFYRQGSVLQKVETDLGSVLFLICGDLFDETLQRQAHELQPDWVLHPFARSFADKSRNQQKWDREELPAYEKHVRSIGAPLLAASYLCTDRFSKEAETYGGSMVFNKDGKLLTSLPLDQTGTLYFDPESTL